MPDSSGHSFWDWLMGRMALQKAAGTAQAPAPPPSTDPSYLQKQIAMNPNNFPQGQQPAETEDDAVQPVNRLKRRPVAKK